MRLTHVSALAVAVIALISACGPLVISPPATPMNPKLALMGEFDRNLATWNAAGITRYAFIYTPSCFCAAIGTHLVLSDGTAIRIDGVTMDGAVAPPVGVPVGVDGLFETVRRAINGDRATITYDGPTGVPRTMQSDPEVNAHDDELSFTVTAWTLDPPDDRSLGRLSDARTIWLQQNLRTYTWSITVACDCFFGGRRYDVTVRDGEPSVRSGGKRVAAADLDGVPLTVDALFALALADAMTAGPDFAFNADVGYPTRVKVSADLPDGAKFETITVQAFAAP